MEVQQHATVMHDEHRDREVTQDFAGRYRRMLGHRGAPVYRALGGLDDRVTLALNRAIQDSTRSRRVVALGAQRLATVEVLLMVLLGISGRRRSAMEMLAWVGVMYIGCEALGRVWPRRRPFERLSGIRTLTTHSAGRSFPSRHVASGLMMASIGAEEHARLGSLMAVVALLLGASRVVAGLHYPSDVAAGVVLAWATTAVRRALRTKA